MPWHLMGHKAQLPVTGMDGSGPVLALGSHVWLPGLSGHVAQGLVHVLWCVCLHARDLSGHHPLFSVHGRMAH